MKNSYSKLLFFLCTIFILVNISAQLPDFIYHDCIENGNFTDNSTYQTNLQTLLSDISSKTQIDYGFYNFSVGLNSDRVSAIALCRGDVSLSTCRSCIKDSTQKLTLSCPYNKEAIGWYDQCMLRYTNWSNIFGTREDSPAYIMWNPNNVSNADPFNEALDNLMLDLKEKATSGDSRRKFPTGKLQSIYGLVQCTPDLSKTECARCLDGAIIGIPNCCDNKHGGRSIKPSCNIRYERDQFYESSSPSSSSSTNTTTTKGRKSSTSRTVIIIVVSIVTMIIIVCMCIYLLVRKPMKKVETVEEIITVESLQFDFVTIRVATDNFSDANKLGQGGFGAVYKGRLSNGQDIAVKRLSKDSRQGDPEFKNEVMLVARLQHRNLVKLLSFCLEGTEKLLVYEFVANASLDHFIFDPIKRASLDWEKRYKIIGDIARGLLYLHEDSRVRIIHRDLKASNILLDAEMIPKISDFGMARLFVINQTQGNTSRIAGTFGYMAPEYGMHGDFSVKSDVFSFGVLVLEIVSGQKNTSFQIGEYVEGLISYAWRSWMEGTVSNVVDPALRSGSRTEIMRCIHIGLLCVQESISDRPTMASVHLMLNSCSKLLPVPLQPTFFMNNNSIDFENNNSS